MTSVDDHLLNGATIRSLLEQSRGKKSHLQRKAAEGGRGSRQAEVDAAFEAGFIRGIFLLAALMGVEGIDGV